MTGPDRPAVVWRLRSAPTSRGLVVPFVTKWHAGQPMWGSLDTDRLAAALTGKRCQICGHRLEGRAVLFVRAADWERRIAVEPPMHPDCASYARRACPMLNGRMSHYNARPQVSRLRCAGWEVPADTDRRAGRPADAWYELWFATDQLRVTAMTDDDGRDLAGIDLSEFRPLKIRRIRPAGGPDTGPTLLDLLILLG
ncbi:hypothetical protein [Nocardia transvalensis]|uniref:hypothetical protein n=1 Tax=Nocardia transvalensis TaxID=37333 RepID=UPI001894493D|nr:hypothetical protein [Nocardia transvalensis]MBF6333649.1 hypothetical protein [Nocardia transvalensis]